MSDCETLGTVIDSLSKETSVIERKPTVVIDAGIATDDNVIMLRKKGYDYMCVSRSNIKDLYADIKSTPVKIKDRKNKQLSY